MHLNVSEDNGSDILEQVFGRYSFSQDFHLTFGRQVTVLGYDDDEAPGLYAVTTAYYGVVRSHTLVNMVDLAIISMVYA